MKLLSWLGGIWGDCIEDVDSVIMDSCGALTSFSELVWDRADTEDSDSVLDLLLVLLDVVDIDTDDIY